MKLSEETLAILKNFSAINNGIYFEQGNVVKTVSPQKSILAEARTEDTVPIDFGIYDLNMFLGAHSLFESPELTFESNHLVMTSDKTKCVYGFCDSSLVVRPPNKEVGLPSVDVSIKMSSSIYDSVVKAALVLAVPEVAIVGDGTRVKLVASESKNTLGNKFDYDLDESNQKFSMVFKVENFSKLMSRNYVVSVSARGLSKFESEDGKLTYHVAIEPNSNFEG